MTRVRLNRFLSQMGIASRRGADRLIAQGRIRIGGEKVTSLGRMVDPRRETVYVDNRRVGGEYKPIYLILHKPKGFLVTSSDRFGRPTVYDLLKTAPRGLFPVGRLDYDSQGLLLLTNDGDLAHRLLHPRWGVEKRYLVRIGGIVEEGRLELIRSGVRLDDGRLARPQKIGLTEGPDGETLVQITLREGRKREVKRIFKTVGYRVLSLKRIGFNGLKLGDLREGEWRHLTPREIGRLKEEVGLRGERVDNSH